MKEVELSIVEFEKMIQRIKDLENENKRLKETVKFLNNEIKDYNKTIKK